MEPVMETFESRKKHVCIKGEGLSIPVCDKASMPGTVTQRTCVYGGARIVLMPITDSIHLVHGPIGCAACTWDIRGSKSSREDLYKKGCSTDLQEKDIVFGGEKKLFETVIELHKLYNPGAIFVYATCVAGVIGDDIKAVCKKAQEVTGCRVIPVQSEGFQHHNKTKGHWIGGDALLDYVIGTKEPEETTSFDINVVGEFNVAGDFWGIKPLLEEMGVNIISTMTGDSHVEEIAQAHRAKLNIVQCQKSSNYIAQKMKKKYGIPFIKVNFFGLEQTVNSLREIADFFGDEEMIERTEKMIEKGLEGVQDEIHEYKERLTGKTVALYVGGNKAWSLVRAFEELGMDVMMSGTKNGIQEDYERIKEVVRDGTIIVDDANSAELARLLKKHHPDLLISGAKEKYISLKLGIPFCDFNHDRISAFAGFKGFISFAKEVDASVSSPVFDLTKTRLTNTPSPEIFTSHKKSLTPLNTGGDDHAS